jgi:small subunit ribosomal protein S3
VTDDSAFKKQVRARMAETGEKYTVARRMVMTDAAIRDAVRRAAEPAAGVSAVDVYLAADPVRVSIRAIRPIVLAGPRGAEADRLRTEMEELTGRRVRLDIREVPGPREMAGG